MKNYPAIFHLRVCRARVELEQLSAILHKMHEACQQDNNGEHSGLDAIDSESLERMEISAESIRNECQDAKRAIEWHRNK